MIVGSILLAFGIDASWASRNAAAREQLILSALLAEFEQNDELLRQAREEYERSYGGAVAILDLLERSAGDAPFFAVLNYMEAHLPLAPERRFRERFMTPEQVKRSLESPLHGLPVWTFRVRPIR